MNKLCSFLAAAAFSAAAAPLEIVEVEGQPLAANAQRLVQALEFLGTPLPPELRAKLQAAITARDGAGVQSVLDTHCLLYTSRCV